MAVRKTTYVLAFRARIGILCARYLYSVIELTPIPWDSGSRIESTPSPWDSGIRIDNCYRYSVDGLQKEEMMIYINRRGVNDVGGGPYRR